MTKLEIVQNIILKYTDITSDIICDLDSIEYPRIHPISIRYLFIKRFHYNSLAISSLIQNYIVDRNFKLPLFLVLRTCVSDFLYLKYVDKIIKDADCDENIEQEIKNLLADNLKYLLNDLEDYKKNHEITKEEYTLSQFGIKQMYPEFFDDRTGTLIKSKGKTFAQIKNAFSQDKRYSLESQAYGLYKLYSKFEHIGALTFDLGKNYVDFAEKEEDSIVMSIIWVVNGLELLITEISENQTYKNRLKDIDVLFEELKRLKE